MTRRVFASVATGLLVLAVACGDGDSTGGAAGGEIMGSTWDVVILGDSYVAYVGEPYADHVAEANDVEVVLHNEWRGGLSADRLLAALSVDGGERGWPALVSEAEVVVYWGKPTGLIPEGQQEHCGNGGGPILESHCDDDWIAYQETLEQIAAEIKRLRDGQPTIIRALEAYSPGIGRWEEAGMYDQCMACDAYARDAIRAAAEAQGVPIAKVWDAFNGPDHTEDPVEKGYISSDGYHPSREGGRIMADLLHNLGYEPTS